MEASESSDGRGRLRSNPRLIVGVAAAAILVAAWIAWAIYVGVDKGWREALGVLIAWPAIAVAVAIVALPFAWAFRRIRRRSEQPSAQDGSSAPDEAEATTTG